MQNHKKSMKGKVTIIEMMDGYDCRFEVISLVERDGQWLVTKLAFQGTTIINEESWANNQIAFTNNQLFKSVFKHTKAFDDKKDAIERYESLGGVL